MQFSLRKILLITVAISMVLAVYAHFEREWFSPRRRDLQIRDAIRSLEARRPPDVTPQAWQAAVFWTQNLHGNSMVPFEASDHQIKVFQEDLNQRLSQPIDLDTIYWIWDEYAKLTPAGKRYQRFRSQMDEEIASPVGMY